MKAEKVDFKYRAYSILMFIFGGINVLGMIFPLIGKVTNYSYMHSMNGRQRYHVVFQVIIIICILGIFAWAKIHSGVLLRKKLVKTKPLYIILGIINICEAIVWIGIIVAVDIKVGKSTTLLAAISTKTHLLCWLWFFICLGGISSLVVGGMYLFQRVKAEKLSKQRIYA